MATTADVLCVIGRCIYDCIATEKYIAKFTWKYADNRLTLEKPYEENAKVFTQQFKDTFQ